MNYTQHFLDPYQQKLQVQRCTRTVIMKKKGFTEPKDEEDYFNEDNSINQCGIAAR